MKTYIETIYLAGGCLWGVQEFFRHITGVLATEGGRANGDSQMLDGDYDGYVECVKIDFDANLVSVKQLIGYLFEIIDPLSINQQGPDTGEKYRTGVYSEDDSHLLEAKNFIQSRDDYEKITVEVMPLSRYLKSADEHQHRLQKFPNEACHIPKSILYKYRKD